ncbi:hypothetical protein IFM89_030716 [Coptis chinensis]|uniref:Uncharacterized protein n=1 Tax=Coptis chinensis TaxID=261450 RepID=A0A835MB11_9MAGN|nr:hypothetical protein IFM89_030716 [Coptis chinensis]
MPGGTLQFVVAALCNRVSIIEMCRPHDPEWSVFGTDKKEDEEYVPWEYLSDEEDQVIVQYVTVKELGDDELFSDILFYKRMLYGSTRMNGLNATGICLLARGILRMNADGAARGNLGIAGWGVVFRDHDGPKHGSAIQQGWQHIWVDTDSVAAKAFQAANKVLWKLRAQWNKIKHSRIWLHFPSSWGEVNFAADTSANKGVQLNKGSKQWWNHKSPFLKKGEFQLRRHWSYSEIAEPQSAHCCKQTDSQCPLKVYHKEEKCFVKHVVVMVILEAMSMLAGLTL